MTCSIVSNREAQKGTFVSLGRATICVTVYHTIIQKSIPVYTNCSLQGTEKNNSKDIVSKT